MYLDHKKLEFPPEFIELIQNKGESDIWIASDSNAHSTVWNCPRTDRCGEFVEDFLISNDLQCVNVGNIPTFHNGSGHMSIIDITVANYSLATSIFNWKVDNDLHIYDHYIISFSISNSSNFRVADVSNWNYRKGDWGLFKRELDCSLLKWSNPSKKPSLVPYPSLPSPPSLRHVFTSTFTSTEVPLFSRQVGKCYIWLRPYRRGLRFGTYLGFNFGFGLRSRGQNVSKWLFFYTNAQIGSVRSCSNSLKFGMNIGLYLLVPDTKKGVYWGPKSRLRSSPVVFCIFEHQGVHLDKTKL